MKEMKRKLKEELISISKGVIKFIMQNMRQFNFDHFRNKFINKAFFEIIENNEACTKQTVLK